jgi:hypothetical protein
MQINPQLYPKLFNKLKTAIKKEIEHNYIVVNKKKFRSNVGRAYPHERAIKIPAIRDLESIYIIFHEIAHVKYFHTENPKKRNYVQELEAEIYALRCLRKFKIHKLFPENYAFIRNRAISYVIQNIYYDIEKGLKVKNINIKALSFCRLNQKVVTPSKSVKASKTRRK